jgi:hypothetical protein
VIIGSVLGTWRSTPPPAEAAGASAETGSIVDKEART